MPVSLTVNNNTFEYPTTGEFTCSCCNLVLPLKKRKFVKKSQCNLCYYKEYRIKYADKYKDNVRRGNQSRDFKKQTDPEYALHIKNKTSEYRKKHKEKIYNYKKQYRVLKPEMRKGESKLRKLSLKKACPSWVDKKQILSFYKNCPQGMQVDHIIPINHPDVCGLHVPWNLQYLTSYENNFKNNSWDGTYNNDGWKK